MPKLTNPNIVEINLPSSSADDPATVKLDTTITTKQALEIASNEDKSQAMIALIADAITEWNFINDQGEPEPVSIDNVGRLSIDDFTVLAERVSESVDKTLAAKRVGQDEKKA